MSYDIILSNICLVVQSQVISIRSIYIVYLLYDKIQN